MSKLENLSDLVTFAQIVAKGSLSGAAKALGISLAATSKRLIRLENTLGIRLINRTTRQLSLTDEGRTFHSHCLLLLNQIERAEEAIANGHDDISGTIRVTASNAFCRRQLAPRIRRFVDRHPHVRIELIADDDIVDIVKHGIDVAIRQKTEWENSGLIAQIIAQDRRILCAAPAYLTKYGEPNTPEDLRLHNCIAFGPSSSTIWSFSDGDQSRTIQIDPIFYTNAGDSAHAAAISGLGIVNKSIWEVAEDIEAGRLLEVLPGWRTPPRPIRAVYPSAEYRPQRTKAFVDFLAGELRAFQRQWPILLGNGDEVTNSRS